MSLGPEKIILILVVALIVFGPQRLPDIARQVGAAMRELRKMQDTVRDELEHVLHPDFMAPNPVSSQESGAFEDSNHAALPAGPASDMSVDPPDIPSDVAAADEVTDDGFAGPRSFS
jgi:Tat protein translocase TatB subunit